MSLAVDLHDGQQLVLVHRVDLVDDQHGGDVQLLDPGDELRLRPADIGDRLHQQKHRVHVGHALLHHLHHVVPQAGGRLVKAGGVQEDELIPPGCSTAQMRLRVVWGLLVTMAIFSPTRALVRVDLPTLGRPRW